MPVSLVPHDEGMPERLGNHFALVPLRMPLNIADPRERLVEIQRRTRLMKHSYQPAVTFNLQRMVSSSPEQLSTALTTYLANRAVGVLSNVPGPRARLTFAGVPLAGLLGWAPCSGDQPMTICIFSYNGKVNVGFGTDRELIPDSDLLAQCFTDAVAEIYEATVGPWPQEVAEGRHGSFER
jgi:diacylglycerol O-acyltransferase